VCVCKGGRERERERKRGRERKRERGTQTREMKRLKKKQKIDDKSSERLYKKNVNHRSSGQWKPRQ